MISRRPLGMLAGMVLAMTASPAVAAGAERALDGSQMGWLWALPFVGILLSIATGPTLYAKFWHNHYGKIAAAWALLAAIPIAATQGASVSLAAVIHALLAEYMSFIAVLFALYTVAGGILITGSLRGTPAVNTAMLCVGAMMASFVGTTGAAMILVRPLLRANAERKHRAHVVVFFIVLVANIGGALSPLGDPPLFIGFLRGVSFFWTLQHLWLQTGLIAAVVLVIFFVVDSWFARREQRISGPGGPVALRIRGSVNFLLIAAIISAILGSAVWQPGISFDVYGTKLELQNVTRDAIFVIAALVSLKITPDEHREENEFSWEPIREVAILFAGIFTAIIPVIAMLQAGKDGAFAWLLTAVTTRDGQPHDVAYFWLTGWLSAFLDNAPTYLVFFELAGGKPHELMGPLAGTLASISMGAVYMGALTYIGNAPNFMIYAIAQERGIRMPNFFSYLLWTSLILVPLFVVLTLLPLAPMLPHP